MIENTLQTLKDELRPILPQLVAELNPPATPDQIEEVASQLPFLFPDELKQLYSIHNGEANGRGLFFELPFISLASALNEWQVLAELSNDDFSDMDKNIVSVPENHIKKNYVNTHYFPFIDDAGSNYIGVDLDPDQEGTAGQIISFGSDRNTRYVIAPTLDDFLMLCVYQVEVGNYTVKDIGDKKFLHLEPDDKHFLDALPQLDLPFRASNH